MQATRGNRVHGRAIWLTGAVGAAWLLGAAAAGQQAASTTLTLEPTKFDPEGSRALMMMSMPSQLPLTAEQPEGVKKAPSFRAEPRWGTLSIGSHNATRIVAVDEPEGEDARIYLDLNGNGDLTDDGDGAWPSKSINDDGIASYSGTWVFDVAWKDQDKESKGKYGLNLYYSPLRDSINYYRAGARVGTLELDGLAHDVTLIENDNDARYNKKFEPDAVYDEKTATKPVWLMIDRDRYDARATFQYGGINYEAFISDDGSQLQMKPTFRAITVPRPPEKRPEMLGTGAAAPDFTAMLWTGSQDNNGEQRFEFSELREGKVVVLDLWATWCGPCIAGLPHLSRVAEQVEGQNVEIIALNVYDEEAAFRKFVAAKEGKYAFKWARDPAGKNDKSASIAGQKFNVFAIPATYIFGKDGKVAAVISGYREGDRTLEATLKELGVTLD